MQVSKNCCIEKKCETDELTKLYETKVYAYIAWEYKWLLSKQVESKLSNKSSLKDWIPRPTPMLQVKR